MAVSVLVLIFFKDSPESLGFPPVEGAKKKKPEKETSGLIQLPSHSPVSSAPKFAIAPYHLAGPTQCLSHKLRGASFASIEHQCG